MFVPRMKYIKELAPKMKLIYTSPNKYTMLGLIFRIGVVGIIINYNLI